MKINIFRPIICCFLLLGGTAQSPAQNAEWLNYTAGDQILGFDFEGDDVWVATYGGLFRINRHDRTRQVYLPVNSGLKGGLVNEVMVDTNGTKWLGTARGGLMRLDGNNWQQFSQLDKDNLVIDVTHLRKDALGRLWFLSRWNDDGYGHNRPFYYDGQKFVRIPARPQASINIYQDIVPDKHGNVWLLTSMELLKITPDGATEVADRNEIGLTSDESLTNICYDPLRDNLYLWTFHVPTNTYQCRRSTSTGWELLPELTGLPPVQFSSQAPNGDLWLYCNDYYNNAAALPKILLHYDGNTWKRHSLRDFGISEKSLNGLKVDRQGHLWVISESNIHLLQERLDDGTWLPASTQLFPIPSITRNILCDDNQHLWLIASKGLIRFDGLTWTKYSKGHLGISTDPYPSIKDIFEGRSTGEMIVSLLTEFFVNETKFLVFDGQKSRFYTLSGKRVEILKIIPLGTEKYWVSTTDGLYHVEGTQWQLYDQSNTPLASRSVQEIEVDLSGNLWAMDFNYNVFLVRDGVWNKVPNQGLTSHLLYCDKAGKMWTSGKGGPAFFNGNEWETVSIPNFPLAQNIYGITQDIDSSYWMCALGGVYHWDGKQQWTWYNMQNAPFLDGINKIQVDPTGNKWFLHSYGLTVYREGGISNPYFTNTNTVSGKVFFDTDRDGKRHAGLESGMEGQRVKILPDSAVALTNQWGNYYFSPPQGVRQITYLPTGGFDPTSVPAIHPFNLSDQPIENLDFGVWAAPGPDTLGIHSVCGRIRCHQPFMTYVKVTNKNYSAVKTRIAFQYPADLKVLRTDPTASTVELGLIIWEVDALPFAERFEANIVFDSLSEQRTGEILYFKAVATTLRNGTEQSYPYDFYETVRCSYDPNDKIARPTGISAGEQSLLKDALDFTIRFQNTGNDTAFTVVIRDTLSPLLDVNTFEVLGSSHVVNTQITPSGVVTFSFRNIQLPWARQDTLGSQGFVSYRMWPKRNTPSKSVVQNRAHIYFDFNPAIVTNTTRNQLVEQLFTATVTPNNQYDWTIWPNPTTGSVWIDLPMPSTALCVFDARGRLLINVPCAAGKTELRDFEPGLYWVAPTEAMYQAKKLVVLGF